MLRVTRFLSAWVALVFVGLQLVSGGRLEETPPPGSARMAKAIDPQVGVILDRSCQDCHSGNTHWPWYGRVAPISWILSRDVRRGRAKLDFDRWEQRTHTANERMELCDAVSDGSMPLRAYTLMHRDARLSSKDVDAICDWAAAPQPSPALAAAEPPATSVRRIDRKGVR
jgi:Haem-binding domain